jgi:hypothetical protein
MTAAGEQPLPKPFEVDLAYLRSHLDDMVESVFSDLQSQFLVLPRGKNLVTYGDFQGAYEVLKRHTAAFATVSEDAIWQALRENALALMVLRTILGVSPPEWADLARSERGSDISQGYARGLEARCRRSPEFLGRLRRPRDDLALSRIEALVSVAVQYITQGAPAGAADTVHRLDKVDTAEGLISIQHAATQHVPYAVLLYERYMGRPFASHRDSVSELVGDVMEAAVEERLMRAGSSHRRTSRAERVPGYRQAPDFFVPDEFNAAVIIEAKITGDDGTARDKLSRVERLTQMRDERRRAGEPDFEVVACIDGRGFGVRRADMRDLLLVTEGKVFTLATLDQLIPHTRLHEFLPISPPEPQ